MNEVERHFDAIAKDYDYYKKINNYYYDNLKKLLSSVIQRNKTVLEIGCGTGDLLFYLAPKKGYGIDISQEMINRAKIKYQNSKNLKFEKKEIVDYKNINFDYVFMSDVIEHLDDSHDVFMQIGEIMNNNTIFICTYANPLWGPLLILAEKMGLKMPEGKHDRYSYNQLTRLLNRAGLQTIKRRKTLLLPIRMFGISEFVNKYLANVFNYFCFIEYVTAKKK